MLETALRAHGPLAARTPARLGADIVAVFHAIEPMPDKVRWVQREIARRLAPAADPVLERGCAAMAEMIDADAAHFDRNGYHNRQHFCEVALTAYFLCELGRLSGREVQCILLAALVHDVVHDGQPHAPFQLERASVERVVPLLAAHGVDSGTRSRIAVLVLATDTALGTRYLGAVRAFQRGGALAPRPPAAAPELRALLDDRALAESAAVLCEADILPSVGLTPEHAMRVQERLAVEWGRPLGVADKLEFIRGVIASGSVGAFFLPNVLSLQASLAALPDAGAEG